MATQKAKAEQRSNLTEINDQDLKKIEFHTKLSLFIAGGFIVIVCLFYFGNFRGGGLSKDGGTWGTFGDYVGGILNPTIAALALYWLVNSIKLQVTELRETNKALKETVETAKKQQNQISLQNFESLFFQLLKTKNEALEEVIFVYDQYKPVDEVSDPSKRTITSSKEAVKEHITKFKSQHRLDWEAYYTKEMLDYTGSYFRICYQIVKLIKNNPYLESLDRKDNEIYADKQKEFFDIFRATLTQHELEAFFFNCLGSYGNDPFKGMMEDYGLFEPLRNDLNQPKEKYHRLTRYAYQYNEKIFEKNDFFKKYFHEIKKLDNIVNKSIFFDDIFYLLRIKLITGTFNRIGDFATDEEIKDFMKNKFKKEIFKFYHHPLGFYKVLEENFKDKIRENIVIYEENINTNNGRIAELQSRKPRVNQSEEDHMQEVEELIKECQTYINKFQTIVNGLKNLTYSDEIIVLLKYGINFYEYLDFKRKQQPLDTSPQST